jgi:hypothetical protein
MRKFWSNISVAWLVSRMVAKQVYVYLRDNHHVEGDTVDFEFNYKVKL